MSAIHKRWRNYSTASLPSGREVKKIKKVLGTLISWLAQSSVGCLSVAEAEVLLKDLNRK